MVCPVYQFRDGGGVRVSAETYCREERRWDRGFSAISLVFASIHTRPPCVALLTKKPRFRIVVLVLPSQASFTNQHIPQPIPTLDIDDSVRPRFRSSFKVPISVLAYKAQLWNSVVWYGRFGFCLWLWLNTALDLMTNHLNYIRIQIIDSS